MKDIHSHLLYGIDDGSKDIDESISLLKDMEKAGVEELILTPHYVEDSKYNCNNNSKEKIFNTLVKEAKKEKININLYLGNEVFITPNLIKLLERGEIRTLNNSRYLLFELPMRQNDNSLSQIVNDLVRKGYIPVLAHPERYKMVQDHPNVLEDYLRSGLLLQGNFTSLFGKYGRKSEKTLKYMLKKEWITFLGSDTHHEVRYDCKKLKKRLLRITKDKDYVEDLMNNNFDRIINNLEIGMIR